MPEWLDVLSLDFPFADIIEAQRMGQLSVAQAEHMTPALNVLAFSFTPVSCAVFGTK
jgi:hypothetical protein